MRRRPLERALLFVPLLLVLVPVAGAQSKGRDSVGRSGWFWQAPMDMERERWEKLTADLARSTLEEWREKAVAWATLERSPDEGELVFDLTEFDRIARPTVEPGEVENLGIGWRLRLDRVPKKLRLELTDVASTVVRCSWPRSTEGSPLLHLGVFVVGGTVACLDRPADVPEANGAERGSEPG